MSKLKIALLSGGDSSEREISLETGEAIAQAISLDEYEVFRYDPKTDLAKIFIDGTTKKFDLVFLALHGENGEDGRLQGMFDLMKIPYVFSGAEASAISFNKELSKIVAKQNQINVAASVSIKKGTSVDFREVYSILSLPMVVKPTKSGSSLGISIVHRKEDFDKAVQGAFEFGDRILIEEYIRGRELTVPVLGNKTPEALPVIEIIPKESEWFDYDSKYDASKSDKVCPALIPQEIREKAQDLAVKLYKEIDCSDFARIDFIWNTETNLLYFLEVNTIPGMTKNSLGPKSAKVYGLSFEELVSRLINEAKGRFKVFEKHDISED